MKIRLLADYGATAEIGKPWKKKGEIVELDDEQSLFLLNNKRGELVEETRGIEVETASEKPVTKTRRTTKRNS